MTSEKRKVVVQITVFVMGAYLLSAIGGILMAKGQDIGGLVFVAGPLIMAFLLRLGKNSWADSGIRFNGKGNGICYLISLFTYPISFIIVLTTGILSGLITISGTSEQLIPLVLLGIGTQIVPPEIIKTGICEICRHK